MHRNILYRWGNIINLRWCGDDRWTSGFNLVWSSIHVGALWFFVLSLAHVRHGMILICGLKGLTTWPFLLLGNKMDLMWNTLGYLFGVTSLSIYQTDSGSKKIYIYIYQTDIRVSTYVYIYVYKLVGFLWIINFKKTRKIISSNLGNSFPTCNTKSKKKLISTLS